LKQDLRCERGPFDTSQVSRTKIVPSSHDEGMGLYLRKGGIPRNQTKIQDTSMLQRQMTLA
jgi:hypothetical protein